MQLSMIPRGSLGTIRNATHENMTLILTGASMWCFGDKSYAATEIEILLNQRRTQLSLLGVAIQFANTQYMKGLRM